MNLLEEKLRNLPDQPGVYIMKDEMGEIIYIGKAVSLKNRVRQYFQSSRNHSPKVRAMVARIKDFEYILTDSELEALILECNLIKKHRPRYNVLLKDDKHYPYIEITTEEDYPRILITRKIKKDKNRYYGPFTNPRAVRETIGLIKKIFPIRSCNKNLDNIKKGDRPCLYYHINQCQGPCMGDVDKKDYQNMIKEVCKFLDGKYEDLLYELKKKMEEAAEKLQFEKAALFRDKIAAVEQIMEKQKVLSTDMADQDVIAVGQRDENSIVQIFFIRSGKLIGTEQFVMDHVKDSDVSDILGSFIKQFYLTAFYIPKEIILQESFDELPIIERWLSDKKGSRVYIRVPQKGEKRRLVEMAIKNASEALANYEQKAKRENDRTLGAVEELAKYIKLECPPMRIEAFDISNIQGTDSVASMVVFEGGKPSLSDYRRFKIKGVEGPNDFASMAEVIERRFKRGISERNKLESEGKDLNAGKFSKFPDLILIDGGKGQLNEALKVLDSLGLGYIPAIGLAKKYEEVYVRDQAEPIIIPRNSNALHLLQRIRDEAHRFAITYHRSLRNMNRVHSVLEDIPLIGPKRRAALFKHFGSIEAIRKASLEELMQVEGMNRQAAENIQQYLGMDSSG